MTAFSFVVAAYNVASYIDQCVTSLLRQTFDDFEIIIVDDASTDETLIKAQALARTDSRITVVSQPYNTGTHLVRKRGAEMASGEWIVFVDADDELVPDALSTLSRTISDSSDVDTDMIYFGRDVCSPPAIPVERAEGVRRAFAVSDCVLEPDEAIRAAFSTDSAAKRLLWTVISIATRRPLVLEAFKTMGDRPLGRMEDAFEFLVLLARMRGHVVLLSDELLRYHWGRGVTGTRRIGLDVFEHEVRAMRDVYDRMHGYAVSENREVLSDADSWLSVEIPQNVSTEMASRVSPDEHEQAALIFSRSWGTDVVTAEMNRLIVDRAKTLRKNGEFPGSDDELWHWRDIHDVIALSHYPGIDGCARREDYESRLTLEATDLLGGWERSEEHTSMDMVQSRKIVGSSAVSRLAIFCFYDPDGHASSFISTFLEDLSRNISSLVVVVNGRLDNSSRAMFERYSDMIVCRENEGLDAAAYRQMMLDIGWERLEQYDEVICLNDTCLGPVYPFSEMFREMGKRPVDFWGITAYAGETVNDEVIPTHLQAYWQVYRRSLVSSAAFHEYWENMPLYSGYAEVTRKHEMTFTKHFEDLGFTWDSYVDWRDYSQYSSYPLLYMPTQLVRDARCPVFKRRVFFVPYEFTFDQTGGQPALDLFEYLRDHTTYDVDLIWDSLLQSYNVEDLRKAMHLDYVLPARALNPRTSTEPRSAFIMHIFFMDLLSDTLRYTARIPPETDLFVTTNPEKVDIIKQAMKDRGIIRNVTYIPVINRGRDVSALLVAARDVVLSGEYEVIGFAHDKKSSQNQQSGHHGTETLGFSYKLFENTLGSTEFIRNVITLFADNPRLGQVSPPPPFHALYFAHTRPSDWGPDFDITRDLLVDRLHLHVPLDPAKATMSAIGSCYWFRVDALRPLFAYKWTYEDFLPEGEMGGDGSVSHAIERANGYVAQSQGYYPAWVVSDRYARIEMDSLYHCTDVMLKSLGSHRQGETLLQTSGSIQMQINRTTIYRRLRHNLHRALKWIGKNLIHKLPDPVEDLVYRCAWKPINVLRGIRASINSVRYRRAIRRQRAQRGGKKN